jgi:hypothetical protein
VLGVGCYHAWLKNEVSWRILGCEFLKILFYCFYIYSCAYIVWATYPIPSGQNRLWICTEW